MGVIDDIKNKLSKIQQRINPTIKKVFDTKTAELIALQEKQLFEGSKSDGSEILPKYKRTTIKIKLRKKPPQPTDRVTLKNTGDFYDSLKVTTDSDSATITASVEYSKYLARRYGNDIYGLKREFLKEFFDNFIIEAVREAVKEIIKE